MCPGFTLEHFKSYTAPIDASFHCISLAEISGINYFEGEVIIYSEPSDMAFSLKVSKYNVVPINCDVKNMILPGD